MAREAFDEATSYLLTIIALIALLGDLAGIAGPSKAPGVLSAVSRQEKRQSLARASIMIGIIVLTVGGINDGVFSAVQAAGIGAALTLGVTIMRRKLNRGNTRAVFDSTLRATGPVYLIVFDAFVFKTFAGFTSYTFVLSSWV